MKTFDEMPDDSRVWIYQCERDLTSEEESQIKKLGNEFLEQWTAHGKNMDASLEIKFHRFILILANEKQAEASGCGIDKSVHFIKQIESLFSISLLDRSQIAYLKGEKINSIKFNAVSEALASGGISGETIIFNNVVSKKSDLKNQWMIRLDQSWLKGNIAV